MSDLANPGDKPPPPSPRFVDALRRHALFAPTVSFLVLVLGTLRVLVPIIAVIAVFQLAILQQPFPNLGEILNRYERVLIPELNTGQLRHLLRARWLIDAAGLNKIKGRPFSTTDVIARIEELLS